MDEPKDVEERAVDAQTDPAVLNAYKVWKRLEAGTALNFTMLSMNSYIHRGTSVGSTVGQSWPGSRPSRRSRGPLALTFIESVPVPLDDEEDE